MQARGPVKSSAHRSERLRRPFWRSRAACLRPSKQSRVLMFCPLEPFRITLLSCFALPRLSRHLSPKSAAQSIKSLLGNCKGNHLSRGRFRHFFDRADDVFARKLRKRSLARRRSERVPKGLSNRNFPSKLPGKILNLGAQNEDRYQTARPARLFRRKGKSGEIIFKRPRQRAVFIGGLAAAVLLIVLLFFAGH